MSKTLARVRAQLGLGDAICHVFHASMPHGTLPIERILFTYNLSLVMFLFESFEKLARQVRDSHIFCLLIEMLTTCKNLTWN